MAENNWLLNDSAPVSLSQEFAAAASPWAFDFSIAPGAYMWTAQSGSPPSNQRGAMLMTGVGGG